MQTGTQTYADSPSELEGQDFRSRWATRIFVIVLVLLTGANAAYVSLSRIPPSTDEAHYMGGALSIARGLRSGTLSGVWAGYKNALGFKAPLVCVPAAILMVTVPVDAELACMLSLVLTFVLLGVASYSLFRKCFRSSYHAMVASFILLTMPMVTGLTHRLYPELLLLLLTVVYIDILGRDCWKDWRWSLAAGVVLGLGLLCKITFAGLIAAPTAISLVYGLRKQTGRRLKILLYAGLAGAVSIPIALSWYATNLAGVLEHSRNATNATDLYYPQWWWVYLSSGPSMWVAILAAFGFGVLLVDIYRNRRDSYTPTWALVLAVGLSTLVAVVLVPPKATRYSVTWLPAFALLAAAAYRHVDGWRMPRLRLIVTLAVVGGLCLHNSFGILPLPRVHLGDASFIDDQFPLNIPGWFDDNHPVDRRNFRMRKAEAIIGEDIRRSVPPWRRAEVRLTHLGLMLNHDYFQFLAALHNRPANYSWWPGTVTEGDNAPDYIVSFKGFRNIHPGAHFIDFYPEIESDVASRRVPYKLLSTVNGPGKTQILVFRNVRLDSERPRG